MEIIKTIKSKKIIETKKYVTDQDLTIVELINESKLYYIYYSGHMLFDSNIIH